jgi:phage terminase large subunit-like protein
MTMPDFKYKPTPLMLPTSRYDVRRADFAVNFISMLKHTTGEWYGKPFQLMPWQEQIIRDIFGIVGEDGYRQFRTAYVEVGKKNGKSELAAANRPLPPVRRLAKRGAEVYSCAADINQASIVFNTAKAIGRAMRRSSKAVKTCAINQADYIPAHQQFL